MRPIDADAFKKYISEGYYDTVCMFKTDEYRMLAKQITESILSDIDEQPTIQPEKAQLSQESTTKDTISRQAALEKVRAMQTYKLFVGDDMILVDKAEVQTELMMLPTIYPVAKDINVLDKISRRAVLDEIKAVYEWHDTVTIERLIEHINNLPSVQPEPQWIPCEERMPEESGYYIITANDGVGHRTTFAKFQKKAKSWNLTGARSYWRVIAWMPLPAPYQKGAKD